MRRAAPRGRQVGRRRRRLRALFINENIGGHATMHQAIRKALAEHDDVDVEIRHVPRARGIRRLASARVPGLAKLDVDFQPLRSQLAQSWHVRRRMLADAEAFDVVHVYTHNAGLLSHRLLASMPSVVSLDGTTEQNAYTLPQRAPTRFTPLTVRASRARGARLRRSHAGGRPVGVVRGLAPG